MRVTAEQRRHRLWNRHHLAEPVSGDDALVRIARDLVGLHATDPAAVFLGLRARAAHVSVGDVEQALYQERVLARILAMRRTMFVAAKERLPVLHAAASLGLAAVERRRNIKLLERADVPDPDAWHDRVADLTLEALGDLGSATAVELTEAVPELGLRIPVGKGKWAGKIGMSSRILLWLAIVGRVSRAEPLGSWKSTMYRWTPTRDWLGVDLDASAPPIGEARAELVRHYLAAFGPATFEDVHWWTGWNKTQTRKALSAVGPTEVDLDGATGLVMPGDAPGSEADGPAAVPADPGHVVLLPPLDTTTMGWKERTWYLGELGELAGPLFDRNGNAGPTIWQAGRVIGGWAHRDDGRVAVRLLLDLGVDVARAAEEEAVRLADWLGEDRVIPRFRTRLEKELLR